MTTTHGSIVWSLHHTRWDAITIQLIISELTDRYNGVVLQPRRPFQALVKYQEERKHEATHQFWRKQHAGAKYKILFHEPDDYQPSATDFALRHLPLGLPAGLPSTTPTSAVVFTAWALVFAHVARTPDVPFMVIRSGRVSSVSGIETILGEVNDWVPLRVHVPLISGKNTLNVDTTIFTLIRTCAANLDATRPHRLHTVKDFRAVSEECNKFMDAAPHFNFLPSPDSSADHSVLGAPQQMSHIGGLGKELAVGFGPGGFIKRGSVDMGIFWDRSLYVEEFVEKMMDRFERVLKQVVGATRETRVEDVMVD